MTTLRRTIGNRVRQFGTRPFRPVDADTVFARARPEIVTLTERYGYHQDVSQNSRIEARGTPSGAIELVVPFDGEQYVTRQATADVAQADPTGTADALIGHLLLTDHAKTDLADWPELSGYGALPIRIPVGDPGIDLQADVQACRISHDYGPDRPELTPVKVDVRILDPDSLDQPMDLEHIVDVPKMITQQVGFRPHLLLRLQVWLMIASHESPVEPTVSRVSLSWPTITSLGALHLHVGGVDRAEAAISYNPVTRSIEWREVVMRLVPDSQGGNRDVQTYLSEPMLLLIEQPGELFERSELDGEVEVTVPGRLLSGTGARLYDGIGAMPSDRQPELSSVVTNTLHLALDDVFARRELSPYQHLHFDEVIPNEMRIADIVTALRDAGFEIRRNVPLSDEHTRQLLLAERSEGPGTMRLWLFVEGSRYRTKRQRHVPGGQTFESEFDSGELKIYLCGQLPRDSRELTHEMNSLQRALRERFDRVRSSR